MLIAAGAIEGWTYYLINFTPSSTSEDKRLNEERIRCESDLKRIYIYPTRSIQTARSNKFKSIFISKRVANAFKETNIKRPEERRRALQVFPYFIKEFRDKIDTSELEIKDLAMGIRGYEIFTNITSEDSFDQLKLFF
ncbi:unnamed protein product [Rotaria sp. Silwood2]|nr:unnamed protein product [Rotaria sp. Silwood2]